MQSKTVKLGDYRGSNRVTVGEELEMMVHAVNLEENLVEGHFHLLELSKTMIVPKQEFLNNFPILQHPFNFKNQKRDSKAPFPSLRITFLFYYYNSRLAHFPSRFPHFTVEPTLEGKRCARTPSQHSGCGAPSSELLCVLK